MRSTTSIFGFLILISKREPDQCIPTCGRYDPTQPRERTAFFILASKPAFAFFTVRKRPKSEQSHKCKLNRRPCQLPYYWTKKHTCQNTCNAKPIQHFYRHDQSDATTVQTHCLRQGRGYACHQLCFHRRTCMCSYLTTGEQANQWFWRIGPCITAKKHSPSLKWVLRKT